MRRLGWLIPAALAAFVLAPWLPSSRAKGPDATRLASWPVQNEGRVKPLDTVARSTLLMLRGKASVRLEGRTVPAVEWLLDVMTRPEADAYQVFRIDDPEVLGLLGRERGSQKYFSFRELDPAVETLGSQAEAADKIESAHRSRFQAAVVNLWNRLTLYQRLRHTLQAPGTEDLPAELDAYAKAIGPGMNAVLAHQKGSRFDRAALERLGTFVSRYELLAGAAWVRPLPPAPGSEDWLSAGDALLRSIAGREVHPGARVLAAAASAWRRRDAAALREISALHLRGVSAARPKAVLWARREALFNKAEPFYRGMVLYLAVFLLVAASWLSPRPWLKAAAWRTLLIAFAAHTVGLIGRMVIEGRPPVTNLYSSAVFVGWVAAGLGTFLERRQKDGLGAAAASLVGFCTLLIAHHLSSSGDTMEMMRAVLDSNFWLATHVVTITVGYGSTFLAGALAHVYILGGLRREGLKPEAARSLASMTYGVVCFSLFFSFVGTVLGGIWADQSWGRFWGWDPKENGALLIVLWNALILHARWGGFIRERGLMAMAVFGDVVTALSWFGVNMLGIGLHAYGFMDKAFWWLAAFCASQLLVLSLPYLPLRRPAAAA